MKYEEAKKLPKGGVHVVLAYSYSFYFFGLLLGMILDFIFPIKIFDDFISAPLGMALIIFATLLIFWAQHTSRNLKTETLTVDSFCKGPYCYTRGPTHLGLGLLIFGFGILTNTMFISLLAIVAYVVTRLTFLNKEESMLAKKYGAVYLAYKKKVRL